MLRAAVIAALFVIGSSGLAAGAALAVNVNSDQMSSYDIQAWPRFQRLGDYWVTDNPTYRGALIALGPSSSCHLANGDPTNVVARWRAIGVQIELITYGLMPRGKNGCTAPSLIKVSTIRATGRQWQTSRGLHVGDSVSRLKRLYRGARATKGLPGWYRAGYWLVTKQAYCVGGPCPSKFVTVPVLVAEATRGMVKGFTLIVGAQGD